MKIPICFQLDSLWSTVRLVLTTLLRWSFLSKVTQVIRGQNIQTQLVVTLIPDFRTVLGVCFCFLPSLYFLLPDVFQGQQSYTMTLCKAFLCRGLNPPPWPVAQFPWLPWTLLLHPQGWLWSQPPLSAKGYSRFLVHTTSELWNNSGKSHAGGGHFNRSWTPSLSWHCSD